jgi:O-antigen/teichoic acid export membrane protein
MADRFVIGSRLGPVAVTIYTVPTQVTSRLGPIAGALTNALFPRFATADKAEADRLTRNGLLVLFVLLTPAVAFGLAVMAPVLHLWLGAKIGDPAGPIGRIMLITAWLNVFGQVPFARLQATGAPETVAKANMCEVPFYLALLWALIAVAGLEGAAIAALVRILFDTHLMQWLAARRFFNVLGVVLALALFATEEFVVRAWHPDLLTGSGIGFGFACIAAFVAAGLLPRELKARAVDLVRTIPMTRGISRKPQMLKPHTESAS